MIQNRHNRYSSYPDWFKDQKKEQDQQPVESKTIVYSSTTNVSSEDALTNVTVEGDGNAITNATLDGQTLILKKELEFVVKDATDTDETCLWELKYNEQGIPYLYANYDIATLGGYTMYVDNGNLNLPNIYDGLPIDHDTIYWKTLPDGSKILKAKFNESGATIEGATQDWVISQDYVNKTTLYDILSGYVTIKGDQIVEGVKNFYNGIKITDIPIKKYQSRSDTLFIDGNLVLSGSLVMFANTNVDIPTFVEGLPFDQKTIWFNPETKLIEVIGDLNNGGNGDGVSNFWQLNGIPSWITKTKPIYTYQEIKNTPDLNIYVTSTQLEDVLKNYVTLDGEQDITGIKNFVNGLKISNITISKLQKDVLYIDANLVVKGGVTMFYENGDIDLPTIKDQIGVAGYDGITGLVSLDSSQFNIDKDGVVTIKNNSTGLDESKLSEYLTTNRYATHEWVANQGYASTTRLNLLDNEVEGIITELDTKWTQNNTKISNWDTAYGWGNHADAGYASKTYVNGKFVTIAGEDTITGKKDFTTGGLFINGNQIQYDPVNKYWKLEGNLLVTGGITQYANNITQ